MRMWWLPLYKATGLIRREAPIQGAYRPIQAATALSTAKICQHISTKRRSDAAFERGIDSRATSPLLLLLLREHTPLAHNEQGRYARYPVRPVSCVYFQPALPSALTATNIAGNAVVDCTDSVAKPIRTSKIQCSAPAMIALPPRDL